VPKIVPRRLPQAVSSQVLSQIIQGQYPVGANLPPENELAEQYGVSRTVAREAIRILASKEVVRVRQGRPTSVNAIKDWDQLDPEILLTLITTGKLGGLARDMVEIRKMLEVEAAELAAMRATEEDKSRIRQLLSSMLEHANNATVYLRLESEFHTAIWHAANNVLLLRLLDTLYEVFNFAKEATFQIEMVGWDYGNHLALVETIEAGDTDGAREAMERDIASFDGKLRLALEAGLQNYPQLSPMSSTSVFNR
jgi:GntR family transcriptional repressor for pyruvate dehydrogenase complex